MHDEGHIFYQKPDWVVKFEAKLGGLIPLHPHLISATKLFILTPLILQGAFPSAPLSLSNTVIILLFLLFGVLDYLDGVVARAQDKQTKFGLLLDRVTDYPLLVGLGYLVLPRLPLAPVLSKLLLDGCLLIIYFWRGHSTENRIRTGINYITLLLLLGIALEIDNKFLNRDMVTGMLLISIATSAIVLGRNIGLLHRRLIADALSMGNLLCGAYAIYLAHLGRLDLSLLFILLGAAFDGMDGAAARKFGSTRFGVYSDDIADGFTYGITPGVIIILHFNNIETSVTNLFIDAVIIGGFYALFTISRLIFFTLNKANSDPNYFQGVPSTLGGIVVVAAAYLFDEHIALIGLMVGMACVLMVSFDARYRHVGRLLGARRSIRWISSIAVIVLLLLGALGLTTYSIGLLLAASLVYGFLPVVMNFRSVLIKR